MPNQDLISLPAENQDYAVWITESYLKACSVNSGALVEWAKGRPEALVYWQTCRDKWVGEQ